MINLKHCYKRKEQMYKLYNEEHLITIDAYNGSNLKYYDDILLPTNYTNIACPNEYGCTLSHIKAIKQSFDNGDNCAFIIEDDMHNIYSHLWDKSLREIIQNSPTNSECIIFYSSNPEIQKKFNNNPNEDYMLYRWTWSTGCYYINRNGMKKILDKYIKNYKIDLSQLTTRHDVIADANAIYPLMNSYFYTKPTFIDCCEESIIHPNQINAHKQNHNYVVKYFEQKQNKLESQEI